MKCPFCGNADSQVKDSRPSDDGAAIRRRRSCPNCGGRFTTFERVQLRELVILKRNGRRTPFDRDKLERSLAIALRKRPIQPEQVEQLVSRIVRQLESLGETEIPSSTVGDFIMKALKGVDEVAYVRYASVYKDFRATGDFARFLGDEGLDDDARPDKGRGVADLMRITWKVATSLDGRIGTSTGESQWITGPESRAQGHRLRAAHDAVLVGVETVLADDPRLTVRLPGEPGLEAKQPLRVVLDSKLRTPSFARIAAAGTMILTTRDPMQIGPAEVVRVAGDQNNRPSVEAVVETLAAQGVNSLMIEGGGRVAACFVSAGLVDAIEWFRAPILLGGDERPGVAALNLARLAHAPQYRRLAVEPLGDDLWERYERRA